MTGALDFELDVELKIELDMSTSTSTFNKVGKCLRAITPTIKYGMGYSVIQHNSSCGYTSPFIHE